jgi:acyl-[acyl carrier protein]--UDP-N-acetylglucosamine O-acyltransferase
VIKDIIIIGAGNPDIIKLIESINAIEPRYNIIGFLEKDVSKHGQNIFGYEIIGDDTLLSSELKNVAIVLNVFGSPQLRLEIVRKIFDFSGVHEFPNIIHPNIDLKFVKIGEGNIVYDNVSFASNINIGNFNMIYPCASIGHETEIGNYNLIAANVMIGGRCRLGSNIIFGNSCSINASVNLVDNIFVGIGSVVTKSISRPVKLFGNPARELKIPTN